MERRLAAILAADVVGYSRLMGEDEAGTHAALRQFRRELLAPALDSHNGNLIKSMGDGWLMEFASAADAAACALHLQAALKDDETINLRIGVHIGNDTSGATGTRFEDFIFFFSSCNNETQYCFVNPHVSISRIYNVHSP